MDCSDKKILHPGTVKSLRFIDEAQDGLHRLGGLIPISDQLREEQDDFLMNMLRRNPGRQR